MGNGAQAVRIAIITGAFLVLAAAVNIIPDLWSTPSPEARRAMAVRQPDRPAVRLTAPPPAPKLLSPHDDVVDAGTTTIVCEPSEGARRVHLFACWGGEWNDESCAVRNPDGSMFGAEPEPGTTSWDVDLSPGTWLVGCRAIGTDEVPGWGRPVFKRILVS